MRLKLVRLKKSDMATPIQLLEYRPKTFEALNREFSKKNIDVKTVLLIQLINRYPVRVFILKPLT